MEERFSYNTLWKLHYYNNGSDSMNSKLYLNNYMLSIVQIEKSDVSRVHFLVSAPLTPLRAS